MRYVTYILTSFLMCCQPLCATERSRPEDAVRAFISHMAARNTNAILASFWITSDGQRECVYDSYVARRDPTDDFPAQPLRTFVYSDCALCMFSVTDPSTGNFLRLGEECLIYIQDKWLILPPGRDSLSEEQQERFNRLDTISAACRDGADRANSADKSSEFVTSLADTNGYIGTWSNGKSEFSTVFFSLGHNGQGIFGTAVAAMSASWIRTTNGIAFIPAGKNDSSEKISFELDSDNHVFWSTNSSGLDEAFVRVDATDPADYETQGEEYLKKKHEENLRIVPPPPPTIIATPTELISHLRRLISGSDSVNVTISSANKKTFCLIQRYASPIFLRFHTIRADNTLPFSAWEERAKEKPTCTGEGKIIVPTDRVVGLQSWLATKKVKKGSLFYTQFRTMWHVTGYTQSFQVELPLDTALCIEVIDQCINQPLAPFDFPVEIQDQHQWDVW